MADDLSQYSCQIALPHFGEAGQQKLGRSKVLVVGLGGLGCPVAQYLAAAGVGTIGLADYDTISASNLNRQILYGRKDVGLKKVTVAAQKLRAQNPHLTIVTHDTMLNADNVMASIDGYDIIVDCTDTFAAKYLLDYACVQARKPLIIGAVYQYEGQVALCNTLTPDGVLTSSYRDIYPSGPSSYLPDCQEAGVIPTLVGIIGCIQANEVIKYIVGIGESLAGKLLLFDAQTLQSRVILVGKRSTPTVEAARSVVYAPTIAAADLRTQIHQYHLVDVRSIEERNMFSIGGQHIPLADIATKFTPDSKPTVFYCASGMRSTEAVAIVLQKFPGIRALSLDGGLHAWKELAVHG